MGYFDSITNTGIGTSNYEITNIGCDTTITTLPYICSTSTPYGVMRDQTLDERIEEIIDKKMKEDTSMDNFMNGMFGPIKGGLCRLSIDGNIAIKTRPDGGYKAYNPASKAFVNCDNFVFDIGDEMFFVIPTNTIAVGDIILAGNDKKEPKYVLKVDDDRIEAINYKTGNIDIIIPERHVFMGNTYFYGKIVSMFGNIAAGGGQVENVMKYMMLNQMMKGSGGNNGFNPMMFMLMGNNGIGNIFGDLFGGLAPKAEPKTDEAKE